MSATHPLTDVDGTKNAASSGFLNMFERDLDVESFPTRKDTPDSYGGECVFPNKGIRGS